jgi:polar amino acid transport system substrate-binding protein
MQMQGQRRLVVLALLGIVLVGTLTLTAVAAVDEYGTRNVIPGISFTGGDGSYKRVLREGIMLGISPDFPWTYQDEQTKEYKGLDVEILKEATRRVGITKVSYSLMPFDGLIPALLARRIDVVAENIHENPKRLEAIDFTGPAFFYGAGLVTQKGNPKKITSWAGLSGKRLGVIRGTLAQSIAEQIKGLKELKLYSTADTQYADLTNGRLDAVLDDDIKNAKFIKDHPGINMELSPVLVPLSLQQGYARYGIRKEDVDLNNAISRAIAEMRADSTMMRLIVQAGLPAWDIFNFPIPR